MAFTPRLLLALAGASLIFSCAHGKDHRVVVAPVSVDRLALVVSFKLPPGAGRTTGLKDATGTILPLQVTGAEAVVVIPEQKAGETLSFLLTEGPVPAATVQAKADKGQLRLTVAGRPLLNYQMDREALPRTGINPEIKRAGYIHPVYSPSGKIVTDDYPTNHVHHHGIWTPWTKTKFQGRAPDFWNMQAKTGAEDFVALDRSWSGAVHGGFESRLKMVDLSAPAPVTALHETWRVTAYAAGPAVQVFDLEITQECATSDPLELPKYHYGGFGFRGADAWNGPGEAALFLTSEGETSRLKGNDTRGRWCYLGGKLDGAISGTAILGHPANFRAPQPMRLHPNMPYMSFVPQQLGEFAIEPGKPYVARFRFVVSDGAPDRAKIDAFWNGYAQPAVLKVEAVP